MKVNKLSDMHRGWLIGNFEPSLLKTADFEVGLLLHKAGEVWPAHYHAVATEYNVLISGHMEVCGIELVAGDTFTIFPHEVAAPIFYTDCYILCVKHPSIPTDKILV
jgi:quercetin dioxygenase-like cupin family protein